MVSSYMIKQYFISPKTRLYSLQHLAITGPIRGISKENQHNELGLETLEKRRWYGKLCCFFNIFRYKCPKYPFNIIPTSVGTYNTGNTNNIPLMKVKHNFFQNSFFSPIIEWNKLDLNIHNSKTFNIFKKTLLNFIRPSGSTVFNCHNPKGAKLLTTLRLDLSNLRKHKFKHSF